MDRYGEPPKGVLRLIDIALLRAAAAEAGICEIHQKGLEIQFTLAELDLDCVGRVCSEAAFQGRVFFAADEKRPMLKMKLHRQDDVLQAAQFFVKTFASFVSTAKY